VVVQRHRDRDRLLHLVAQLHGQTLNPVKIKIPLTLAMLITSIVLFVWRLEAPNILDALSGAGLLYILLVLSLSAMVTVIGWNGASMTFRVEKE